MVLPFQWLLVTCLCRFCFAGVGVSRLFLVISLVFVAIHPKRCRLSRNYIQQLFILSIFGQCARNQRTLTDSDQFTHEYG